MNTEFDAVLADLDDPLDEAYDMLVPEDEEEDGEQTDEAHDEADDDLIDEIDQAQSQKLVLKKEDVLEGKQALEKVRSV